MSSHTALDYGRKRFVIRLINAPNTLRALLHRKLFIARDHSILADRDDRTLVSWVAINVQNESRNGRVDQRGVQQTR